MAKVKEFMMRINIFCSSIRKFERTDLICLLSESGRTKESEFVARQGGFRVFQVKWAGARGSIPLQTIFPGAYLWRGMHSRWSSLFW